MPTVSHSKTNQANVQVDSYELGQNQAQAITETTIQLTQEDIAIAKSYKLSVKEMKRYKYLVEYTPRKFWSPNIDPITLLGIEARNVNEQLKYATKWIELEKEREIKEIAFDDFKNELVTKMFPNSFAGKSYREIMNGDQKGFQTMLASFQSSRTVLFVDAANCNVSCKTYAKRTINSSGSTNQLDIYFLNAESDSVIQQLANDLSIPEGRVISGTITIQHDMGNYNQLRVPNKQLPIGIIQTRSGQEGLSYE